MVDDSTRDAPQGASVAGATVSFVHSGMIMAAGVLAGAPLLIHLLSRRAYKNVPWAAMQFLVAAQEATRRRMRIEQWLLLALRVLIVALVGLTLARPFVTSSDVAGALGASSGSRIVVLDDSLSMRAQRADGKSCFDAALDVARRLIDESGARESVGVVLASNPARKIMDRCTGDHQAVRESIASLRCSSGMNDLDGAITAARELLSSEGVATGTRTCFVITDMTATAFVSGGSPSDAANRSRTNSDGSIDRLVFMDVGPDSRRNIGVRNLQRESQIMGPASPVVFSLEVFNNGPESTGPFGLQVEIDGARATVLNVEPLAPWKVERKELEVSFATAGSHRLLAKIVDEQDVLPDDDGCNLAVYVPEVIRILGVEDSIDPFSRAGPLFYLQAALGGSSTEATRKNNRFDTCTSRDLTHVVLSDFDVIMLGDLPRMTIETGRRLQEFVMAGGGLIVILANHATSEGYQGHAVGEGSWLPGAVADVQRASTPDAPFRMVVTPFGKPSLRELVESPVGGLQRANVFAYRRINLSGNSTINTFMEFSDGSPALLHQSIGRGVVYCWLTSMDMTWTNFPGKPDFVPLALNLLHLAAAGRGHEVNTMVGQDINWTFPIAAGGQRLRLLWPDGHTDHVAVEPERFTAHATIEKAEVPGFYSAGAGEERRVAAVNIDSRDSDLSRASMDQIKAAYGDRVEVVTESEIPSATRLAAPPHEFALILMISLLTAVILETFLSNMVGGPK